MDSSETRCSSGVKKTNQNFRGNSVKKTVKFVNLGGIKEQMSDKDAGSGLRRVSVETSSSFIADRSSVTIAHLGEKQQEERPPQWRSQPKILGGAKYFVLSEQQYFVWDKVQNDKITRKFWGIPLATRMPPTDIVNELTERAKCWQLDASSSRLWLWQAKDFFTGATKQANTGEREKFGKRSTVFSFLKTFRNAIFVLYFFSGFPLNCSLTALTMHLFP